MDQGSWVAVDASTDHRRLARTLARVHHDVVGGGKPPRALRASIAKSWKRCASAGVDPEAGSAPISLSEEEVAGRWLDHPLSVAEPVLRDLFADVSSDDDQVVLVCDADGTLLWIDGEPALLDAAREVHLEPGAVWSEKAAGTNAMGTALEIDHPIQVFSAEHFSQSVHAWTCSAAPVSDPETGARLGVIDLSGEISTAHPHSLALIEAAARMTEAELRRRMVASHQRLRDRWGDRLTGRRKAASALTSAAGTVVMAARGEWMGRRLTVRPEGGTVDLGDGLTAIAEPLAEGQAFLVWQPDKPGKSRRSSRSRRSRQVQTSRPLKIEALGRDRARIETGDGALELSRRHSEILVVLALQAEATDADHLAREIYGENGNPVTARAEVSRLRRILGERLPRGELQLAGPIDADFLAVESLMGEGHLGEALERYRGALLPGSRVPLLVETRERLDLGLRDAALHSHDRKPMALWLETPSGRDDVVACRTLISQLSEGDPLRVRLLTRLRRLTGAR